MKSSGFTLMETVAALGISAILIAAIVPYIYALQAAWAYVGQGSDMVQNGRVGLEYMTRDWVGAGVDTVVQSIGCGRTASI